MRVQERLGVHQHVVGFAVGPFDRDFTANDRPAFAQGRRQRALSCGRRRGRRRQRRAPARAQPQTRQQLGHQLKVC